eukprot:gnl/TRDRNA2_/TRDRNA2_30996_c0_seq1.p2 gnl/TRDRNA2_/TRDRNA2_30996_c0~~gnl/TRDRNA2_/TRDRNA2_30996_c0_seq1.p2  ORF type:complete len:149 (-),score=41.01 gnl/TRDRNA2_/TRDRNA2_30996_c0_seq1:74-520(-)
MGEPAENDVYEGAAVKLMAYMQNKQAAAQNGGALGMSGLQPQAATYNENLRFQAGYRDSSEAQPPSDRERKMGATVRAHGQLSDILRAARAVRAEQPRAHNASDMRAVARDSAEAWRARLQNPAMKEDDVTIAELVDSYQEAKKKNEV